MGDVFSSTGNIYNEGTNGNGNFNNENAGTANGNVVNQYGSANQDTLSIWKLQTQQGILSILLIVALLVLTATIIYFRCCWKRNSRYASSSFHTEMVVYPVPVQRSNRREQIKCTAEPFLLSP
jgi:hypothetical protein